MDSVSVQTESQPAMGSFSGSSNSIDKATIPTEYIIKCDTTFCDSRREYCDKDTVKCRRCSSICRQRKLTTLCQQLCPDYRVPHSSSLGVEPSHKLHIPSKEHSQVIGGIIGSLALVVLVAAGVIVYTSGRGSKRRAARRAARGPGNIYNGPIAPLSTDKNSDKHCDYYVGNNCQSNVQSWLETGLLLGNKAETSSLACQSECGVGSQGEDPDHRMVVIPYTTVKRWYLQQSLSDNALGPDDVHRFLNKLPQTRLTCLESVSEEDPECCVPESECGLTKSLTTPQNLHYGADKLGVVGSLDSGFVDHIEPLAN